MKIFVIDADVSLAIGILTNVSCMAAWGIAFQFDA
jgi:hypothetical protein